MAITDWPAGERPREKLLQHGVSHLSDAELLAIFLRVGTRGQSAVDLARMLLNHFGSLNGIFQAELNEINALNGMGTSKYCQLQAIFEMCRRALSEQMQHGDVLSSPVLVKEYLRLKLNGFKKEVFYALFLDTQNRVKASEILFEGTLTQASVYPREVIKRGLFHNAAAIIFAHNHPSGHAEPSEADKRITNELRTALRLMDMTLHDHFIVAGNQIMSFREAGLL